MHPAMAFTGDVKTEVARLAGARFAVTTGAEDALVTVRCLVDDLGGVVVEVPESKRILYHAALAHGSNHLVTLVVQAAKMLELAGVSIRLPCWGRRCGRHWTTPLSMAR